MLVDKDGVATSLPEATFTKYAARLPNAEEFADTLNAFFWDIVYVAKSLRRGELSHAKYMLDAVIRNEQLYALTAWYFRATVGPGVNETQLEYPDALEAGILRYIDVIESLEL